LHVEKRILEKKNLNISENKRTRRLIQDDKRRYVYAMIYLNFINNAECWSCTCDWK